jgi:hypothetical protein
LTASIWAHILSGAAANGVEGPEEGTKGKRCQSQQRGEGSSSKIQ